MKISKEAVEVAAEGAWTADRPGDAREWGVVSKIEKDAYRAVARAALEAALPHLTAQDVPHVIREAWDEGWEIGYNEALGFQGPANSYAKETTDDVPNNPYRP